MSVLTRIRLVGAIAISLVAAFGLFAMFWLVSFFDVLPGIRSRWLAGALMMGLPLLSILCLVLALSIDASQRRQPWTRDSDPTVREGGAFEASPLEVGRV